MQPLETLLPAIYTALTTPEPIQVEGQEMPVYEHNAQGDWYVLIGQPDANPAGGSVGCRKWSCTILLDCVTQFQQGSVSSAPVDAIASAVVDRLDGVQLPLEGGYAMSRATVDRINAGIRDEDFDGEELDVHRWVRMRFTLFKHS